MNRIRELRELRGWNQEELGQILNVGKGAVSRYEKEERQIAPSTIHALCDLFGCTADYLLGRSSTPWPVISDEDAQLLRAFHAAEDRDREYIRHLLRLDVQEKRDVS